MNKTPTRDVSDLSSQSRMTTAKYVRATEARKRERGLREIRVWVPDNDQAVSAVRALASALCDEQENNPCSTPTS